MGKYYNKSKINSIESQMLNYAETQAYGDSVYQFYQSTHTFLAALDLNGSILNTDSYCIDVTPDREQDLAIIPLYPLEGMYSTNEAFLLQPGESVIIDTVQIGSDSIPYQLQSLSGSVALINMSVAQKLNGQNADPAYAGISTRAFKGTIQEIHLPESAEKIPYPFNEQLFIDQIKEFQTRLLLPGQVLITEKQTYTITRNSIDYQIIILPALLDGEMRLLFAMTSLQPVNEASSVLLQFYPFFFAFTILLVLSAAFFYSGWLVKPLLSLNRVTKKIADMDFSEKLPERSNDELGQLSVNINHLSDELEAYIERLKQDLNHEKQLEETRKRFISGVSYRPEMSAFDICACIRDLSGPFKNLTDEKDICLTIPTDSIFVSGHEKSIRLYQCGK